jgi:DNA-binding MarR family transcriptional regulator
MESWMNRPNLDPSARSSYLAWQASHVLGVRVEKALRPFDLSLAQHAALLHVAWTPDISSAEIARRTGITPQSVGAAVNALVERGLLVRREHPANRRTVLLCVTESGEELARDARAAVDQVDAESFSALTPDERVSVHGLLLRILADLNPDAVTSTAG